MSETAATRMTPAEVGEGLGRAAAARADAREASIQRMLAKAWREGWAAAQRSAYTAPLGDENPYTPTP